MLDYVGHAAVTDRLLTVDPEWSWEPMALGPNGLPAVDHAGNLWIRLTICGVTRIGVGDGKSAKECIGDAIRNAAMRFGVALDLWAKENLVEFARAAQTGASADLPPVAPPLPKPEAESPFLNTRGGLAKKMFALMGELGITDREGRLLYVSDVLGREVESSSKMTDSDAEVVILALERDKAAGEVTAEDAFPDESGAA